MKHNIKVAMSFLPPSILEVMKTHGFKPLKIEESGSLRLSISNTIPVEKKAAAVVGLKKELKSYGLDLSRSLLLPGSSLDDSCLVVKRGPGGKTIALFEESGELCLDDLPAPTDECLARPVKPGAPPKQPSPRAAGS